VLQLAVETANLSFERIGPRISTLALSCLFRVARCVYTRVGPVEAFKMLLACQIVSLGPSRMPLFRYGQSGKLCVCFFSLIFFSSSSTKVFVFQDTPVYFGSSGVNQPDDHQCLVPLLFQANTHHLGRQKSPCTSQL
jgi:hypothetical protein